MLEMLSSGLCYFWQEIVILFSVTFFPVIGHIFFLLHLSSIFKIDAGNCRIASLCVWILLSFWFLSPQLITQLLYSAWIPLPCGMVWRLPLSRKPEWSQDHFIWFSFLRDNFNELLIFQYLKAWVFFSYILSNFLVVYSGGISPKSVTLFFAKSRICYIIKNNCPTNKHTI